MQAKPLKNEEEELLEEIRKLAELLKINIRLPAEANGMSKAKIALRQLSTEFTSVQEMFQATETVQKDNINTVINLASKLAVTEGDLKQSYAFLKKVFSSISDMVFVLKSDCTIHSINRRVTELLGFDENELVGKNISTLIQENKSEPNNKIRKILAENAHIKDLNVYCLRKGKEKALPVLMNGNVIKDKYDKPEYQILSLKNMEELHDLQAQLIHSEKMASLGTIAAGIAHEINNPIAYSMSNVTTVNEYVVTLKELIFQFYKLEETLRKCPQANRFKEHLNKITELKQQKDVDYIIEDIGSSIKESIEGLEQVKEIVNGLRSFSRLDEAQEKEADINDCIKDTLKIIWNELKYKCEIVQDLNPLPTLKCYPGQLNQVFMNLLINSAQAIDKKGIIKISSKANKDHIFIDISDTGKGIPADRLKQIFDPFFTTKPVGAGTGLGLSIVYGIISKHGGDIKVHSEINKGTTFQIQLPLGQR